MPIIMFSERHLHCHWALSQRMLHGLLLYMLLLYTLYFNCHRALSQCAMYRLLLYMLSR